MLSNIRSSQKIENNSILHSIPATHIVHLPGDPVFLFIGKKDGCSGDLFWPPDSSYS